MPVAGPQLTSRIDRRLDQSGEYTCVHMWSRGWGGLNRKGYDLDTKAREYDVHHAPQLISKNLAMRVKIRVMIMPQHECD